MAHRISRRDFVAGAVALGAGWSLVPRLARAALDPAGPGVWLAGDLHCHTTYSHDVWGGPDDDNTGLDESYTAGFTPAEQILNAESRGLDFLAITDHDRVDALVDPGYRSITGRLTLIPGYEHSLSGGHAGCLGVSQVMVDPTTGRKIDTGDDAGAQRLVDAVRALGGIFILNHPFYSGDGSKSWKKSVEVRPDSIEVWNISWPYRHDVFQDAITTSNNYESLPFWETYLDRWGRMPANGGSDNHWRSTSDAQGVGQPTTWVYAKDRSWAAILEAIRAGRTVVCAEPPSFGGARLTVRAHDNGLEYVMGDTVPGSADVVFNVVGAPGQTLKVVQKTHDGVRIETVAQIPNADFTYVMQAGDARWMRAEVYIDAGYWMTALSSPIYFE